MALTSTKEVDFLDQDPPLRGQNYVCLSFVSPEDALKKKDLFFFEKFMTSFSSCMSEFFEKMEEKYPADAQTLKVIKERYNFVFEPTNLQEEYNFFVTHNENSLNENFYKQNNFQTSIRGIKVRGVFDTLKEAEIRAQVLKKIDDKFHVYVAEVGCWCPWSPNPDDIQNQEYAESHLNTLMKHYKNNQEKRDYFYQERKKEMQVSNVQKTLDTSDPWTQHKASQDAASQNTASQDKVLSEISVQDIVSQEAASTMDQNIDIKDIKDA